MTGRDVLDLILAILALAGLAGCGAAWLSARRSDGQIYPARLRMARLTGNPGGRLILLGMFMDVSREKAVEQRLVYLANVDRLTGLDNRTFFTHHLDRLLADPAPRKAAVLFIKLDGRKAVNDCYGHAAGDQVLRQVGERLRACL